MVTGRYRQAAKLVRDYGTGRGFIPRSWWLVWPRARRLSRWSWPVPSAPVPSYGRRDGLGQRGQVDN